MPMGKEFISDYEENKDDIEHWFSIKCEQKYRRFAELLKENGEETTWANVRDLYRYNKRLIFNCFRYISFLEEYFRSITVRYSDDREKAYDEWQEKNLYPLIESIIDLNNKGLFDYDSSWLKNNLSSVRKLRNCISHNRILLETDYKSEIIALRNLLPERYARGFEKDIRGCTKDLSLNEKWTVIFVND